MKQTKHFKRTALPLSAKSMLSTLLLLIAMLLPQGAWAENFISEIKVSVHKDNGETARNRLTNDGYQIVNVDGAADLNGGGGGYYVYIGYKTSTNVADAITGLLIVESVTGFDAHSSNYITNAITYNGKNYYRCTNYDAGDARLDCDLNRGRTGTPDIVLYYTTDGNTSNGGTPLTSISVVGNTTTTGVVYTRHWKYDTAQNGTSDADVYGNTNDGCKSPHYITYTTHTHSLTDVDYDTTNHKYWCASCGYVSAYNAHVWENTGTKVSDATCDKAEVHYQTCKYCKRTNDAKHVYDYGSVLGHSYDADGVCTRDANAPHYKPATLSDGYYQIASYGNLCWFRNEANSGKTINAKLTADINLSGKSWATSIGEGKEFTGIFDGQGHTITGNARKALFCVLAAGSTVKNVVSSGATSKDNYDDAGNSYQSPFVRRNYGTIENCIVKSAYWDSRNSYLGGITGVNETGGIVRNCGFYDSTLRLRNNANTQVGGIVGVNCASGRIENCFTWNINYYNIGSLGSGGIVCENRSGAIVSNCYTNDATPVFKQEGTATNLTSGITAAFITTGEMCYKLNAGTTNGSQVWYQKIGTETFPTPVLKNTANTVYQIANFKCDGKTVSTNTFTYSNNASANRAVDGHGLSEYTPTYTWEGSYAAPTCTFTLKCNQCNTVVSTQNLTPTKVDANHVDATCGKAGNERWTATGSYSKTGDAAYNGTAQVNDYPIPATGIHTFAANDPGQTRCTRCSHTFLRYTPSVEGQVEWPHDRSQLKNLKNETIEILSNTIVDGKGVMEFDGYLGLILEDAFFNCKGIKELTIPNTVTVIGNKAFMGCSNLTGNLILPSSITQIGNSAFEVCEKLEGIVLQSIPIVTSYSFHKVSYQYVGTGLVDVFYPVSISLSYESYVHKGDNPYFPEVASVTAPCSLDLTDSAVEKHASLIHTGGSKIEEKDAAHLVSSNCITDTYHYSCNLCHKNLPATYTAAGTGDHIYTEESDADTYLASGATCGNDATYFYKCANCDEHGTETWTKAGSAIGHDYTQVVDADYLVSAATCGDDAKYHEKCSRCDTHGAEWTVTGTATGLHTFDDVTDPHHTLCTVCDHSFFRYTATAKVEPYNRSVLMNSKNQGIYDSDKHTFDGKNGVMEFDGVLISIGNYAFQRCSGFTGNLIIPNTVTSIGESAFNGCSGFTGNLTIPNSVTSIGQRAFEGCGFTGNLTIPNSVTSIGNYAFNGCSGFTGNLIIPNSVTSIGNSAFQRCSGFNGNLTIPNSVTSIGNSAFDVCSGFTGNLIIPNSVTSIGNFAFEGCSGFTGNLTIGNSVTSIGEYAFNGCSRFTGIEFQSVPQIEGSYAFYSVNCTKAVVLSDNSYVYKEDNNPNFPTVASVTAPCNLDLTGSAVAGHRNLTLNHGNEVVDAAVAATCTTTGLTEGSHCDLCHTVLVAQETIPATGNHTFAASDLTHDVCTVCNHGFLRYEAYWQQDPYIAENLKDEGGNTLTIESHTFDEDNWQGVMEFNAPLVTIGDDAFEGCQFTKVTIPHTVSAIGLYAFGDINPDCKIILRSLPTLSRYDQTFFFIRMEHRYDDDGNEIGDNFVQTTIWATIELDDNSYMSENFDFYYVSSFSYTRNIKNEWGTIVMPFDLENGDDYDLYTLKECTGSELILEKIGNLPAHTPAFIRIKSGLVGDGKTHNLTFYTEPGTSVNLNNQWIDTQLIGELTLTGSYSVKDITEVDGYIISNNKFWNIRTVSRGDYNVYCAPFRAYLQGTLANSPQMLNISWEEATPTVIETLEAITSGEAEIYDLNGRRITELRPGANIVKSANGTTRKVFIK